MSEDNTQQEQPQEPKRAKYAPDPGFTAERDRRMIGEECADEGGFEARDALADRRDRRRQGGRAHKADGFGQQVGTDPG